METIIIHLSRVLLIILFALYTYECFSVFKYRSEDTREKIYHRQNFYMYLIHLNASGVIFLVNKDLKYVIFYLLQLLLLSCILFFYQFCYPTASRLIINNLCMLLTIGFIMITRLDYDKAVKQYKIAAVAVVLTFLIPWMIHKMRFLRKLTWIYALIGIGALGSVMVMGMVSYGAKLSLTLGPVSVQPSEFVKITFVFFIACMLYKNTSIRQVMVTSVVAGIHVLILVASKDLGGALIYFVVYLVMVYVATRKIVYFFGGLACGSAASVLAYQLFAHVRVRVEAWKDPFSVIDGSGYQLAQSLFAIGTGGWMGLGLYQGMPKTIPVVEKDFIFAAISEELGGIFAICLILVCASCFLMFLNIALQIKYQFYKLIALGLGTVYGFQIFLTVGGVIKFIPSTGVTLPLVSYGGSSLLSSFIIFAIIQGLYILREEQETHEDEKPDKGSGRNRQRRSEREDIH